MAIGARITSENLSGKTATVTFVPYTGTTSGTTQNLGEKTIPFNNINSHPYGVYSLYLAEYDYTYTLTIPEPSVDGVQMFVWVDKMVDSENYGAAVLNFNDFTAEVIDLGLDHTLWNNRDTYFSNESGHMFYFTDVSNSDNRIVIFTDSSNTEIARYSGTTDSFDRGILGDKWTYAEFVDEGVLKYSDGTSVYTYTWDPLTHYIDIDGTWDEESLDGTFVIEKWEIGQWNYNGNGQSYIVNPEDGTTTLFKTWTDGTYVRHKLGFSSNFIVVETQNQAQSGDTYTNLQICDTSGTVLETVSLTGDTYNNNYTEFHGTNKFTTVYYNSSDDTVDYKIIHYNGNTETLIETSHVRGVYTSIDMMARMDYWPSNSSQNNGGVVIMFYNYISGNVIGTEVTYCDIVYMFDNQSTFSTYTFADDETKYIQTWGQLSDIYRTTIDNGDDVVSFLTIMSGSTHIESTDVPSSVVGYVNYLWLGNKTLAQIWSNNATDVVYKYINAVGVVTDTESGSLTGGYNSSMDNEGEVAYIKMNTTTGDTAFYIYSGSTQMISTSYYDNLESVGTFNSETKVIPDVLFVWSNGGETGRILTSTGISDELTLPAMGNNYQVRVGKSNIMIVYTDPDDNDYVKFNLYNFSGTLLNSTATTYSEWNDVWGLKDRFVVQLYNNDNDTRLFYLVSEDTITFATIGNHDDEGGEMNDYVWWED
jgi:hypothetical protein